MSDPDFGEELDRMDRNFKRIADERDALRADLAKAQARVAELESGCWCASLKVDGAEALAAVRLAQEAWGRIIWMAEKYAEEGGRYGPEQRDYDEAVKDFAALDQAFGSGT